MSKKLEVRTVPLDRPRRTLEEVLGEPDVLPIDEWLHARIRPTWEQGFAAGIEAAAKELGHQADGNPSDVAAGLLRIMATHIRSLKPAGDGGGR